MKFLSLLPSFILCFFSASSEAATFSELAARGGFYLADNIPIESIRMREVMRAVPRFNRHLTGVNCSAVVLSKTGYVATNIHCLADSMGSLLLPRYELNPGVKTQSYVRAGHYSVFEVDGGSIRVNWTPYIKSFFQPDNYIWGTDKRALGPIEMVNYNFSDVRVVWMGRGHQRHEEKLVHEFSTEELDLLRRASQDIVILKYEVNGNPSETPCIPVAKQQVKSGDPVWVVGHPSPNLRKAGGSAPGNSVVVSLGVVRASLEEDPVYRGYSLAMDAQAARSFWEKERYIFMQDHILMTSADVYGGNSGGAMINERGELLAITYSVSKSNDLEYEGATSFGIKVNHLRDWIAKDMGSDVAEEVFRCD